MIDIPPPLSEPTSVLWEQYSPGYWPQDLVTIPIELGVSYMIPNYYTKRARPLWPFSHESANESEKDTTLHGSTILPYAAVWGAGLYGGLYFYGDSSFEIYPHVSGMVHTAIMTNIATGFTKTVFQRKRPFYDTKVADGQKPSNDDSFSFVSEHSSQAFAFATYSTLMVFQYTDSNIIGIFYGLAAYTTASYIAYTRVLDHAHRPSDVAAGAVLGTAVTIPIYLRVKDTIVEKNKAAASKSDEAFSYDLDILPLFNTNSSDKMGLMVNIGCSF
jgi:membrane-associated phospholipid phosphatase